MHAARLEHEIKHFDLQRRRHARKRARLQQNEMEILNAVVLCSWKRGRAFCSRSKRASARREFWRNRVSNCNTAVRISSRFAEPFTASKRSPPISMFYFFGVGRWFPVDIIGTRLATFVLFFSFRSSRKKAPRTS